MKPRIRQVRRRVHAIVSWLGNPSALQPLQAAAVLVFSLPLFACPAVLAQDTAEAGVEEARAIFDQAESEFAEARYLDSAAHYESAYEIMRDAGRSTAPLILFNIARAYDRAGGHAAEARAAYQRFLAEAPITSDEARSRVGTARDRIQALRSLDEPRGGPVATEQIDVRPVAGPLSEERSNSPIGPILLAAGAGTVVAGVVVGIAALSENDTIRGMCVADVCPADLEDQAMGVETLAIAADILLVSGVLVAATGLILTLVLTDDSSDSAMSDPSLQLSFQMSGLSLTGTF